MVQCENCAAWVEDTFAIRWPILMEDETAEFETYGVCEACLHHLGQFKLGRGDVPEIGSVAAQREYEPGTDDKF